MGSGKSEQTERVERIVKKLLKELLKYKPKKVVLFGSRARGDFSKHSDIDIAVDLDLPFRKRRKLKEKLDLIAGIYTVDLIFLPLVDKKFREKILKGGKILYEENRSSGEG